MRMIAFCHRPLFSILYQPNSNRLQKVPPHFRKIRYALI